MLPLQLLPNSAHVGKSLLVQVCGEKLLKELRIVIVNFSKKKFSDI